MSFEAELSDRSLADPLPASPLALLGRWLEEGVARERRPNPQAMTLATVDAAGRPHARVVLCRGFDAEAGHVVFYTNYDSPKCAELEHGGRAAAVLHWDTLLRQVRLEGPVVRSPAAESDAYFARRPRASQVLAWASDQSRPIASRAALVERLEATAGRFGGLESGEPIPRPPFWGGYRLCLDMVELWVGAAGRAHDRVRWKRELTVGEHGIAAAGEWTVERLQP